MFNASNILNILITGVFGSGTDIKTVWIGVWKWFSDNVINPVKIAWETATSTIGGFFSRLCPGW